MRNLITACAALAGLASYSLASPYKLIPLQRPLAAANGRFGAAVATIGSHVAVGAPGENGGRGAVYLFDTETGTLVREFRRDDGDTDDRFGAAIAGVGTRLVIGAPGHAHNVGAAYAYELTVAADNGTNLPRSGGTLGEEFGGAVASSLSDILVAAPRFRIGANTDRAGSVFFFDHDSLGVVYSLLRPPPKQQVEFGYALAGVGNVIAVGAPFDNQGELGPRNGGALYLYDASSGGYQATIFQPSPELNDRFGFAVAPFGTRVLVGSPRDGDQRTGVAYVYDPAAPGAPMGTFTKPNATRGDEFGSAIAAVGTNVLVGARSDDDLATDGGAAYLFDGAGNWLHTFVNPSPARGDHFGWALGSTGRNIVIGAPEDDEVASAAGRAYLFVDLAPGGGGGNPSLCDDGNVCTIDTGVTTDSCQHETIAGCCNTGGDCDDGDLCNDADVCENHQCLARESDCSDGLSCTTDCSPAIGCVTPVAPPGFDGLLCWVGALRDTIRTEAPSIRTPIVARISRLATTSYTRAQAASTSPARRAITYLKRIKQRMQKVGGLVQRARRKHRLEESLAGRLAGYTKNARRTLPDLAAGLR